LLSFFYFKAGADELVNLIWDEQVTFAELSIDVIIWISIPNKTYDLKENLTVLLRVGLLARLGSGVENMRREPPRQGQSRC
jgi:hypothetical protein